MEPEPHGTGQIVKASKELARAIGCAFGVGPRATCTGMLLQMIEDEFTHFRNTRKELLEIDLRDVRWHMSIALPRL